MGVGEGAEDEAGSEDEAAGAGGGGVGANPADSAASLTTAASYNSLKNEALRIEMSRSETWSVCTAFMTFRRSFNSSVNPRAVAR